MILFTQRFCATLSATFLTYTLSQYSSVNNIIASGICTIALVLISRLLLKNSLIESDIYLGSFIGMTKIILPLEFLILSFFGVFLSIFLNSKFTGFGGKLGSIAYLSGGLLLMFKQVLL